MVFFHWFEFFFEFFSRPSCLGVTIVSVRGRQLKYFLVLGLDPKRVLIEETSLCVSILGGTSLQFDDISSQRVKMELGLFFAKARPNIKLF